MTEHSKKKKILVIRSAARIFNQTLNALKTEFPDSTITVLAPESVKESIVLDPLIDEILTLKDQKRITVFSYGLENVRKLRRRRFDLAVSLYNIDHGMGYSNIDILAWASRAKTVRGYNAKGSYTVLMGKSIFEKYFIEKNGLLLSAVNMLATVVLFALITLGLLAEWCFRKLFSSTKVQDHEFSQTPAPRREETVCAPNAPHKELTRA